MRILANKIQYASPKMQTARLRSKKKLKGNKKTLDSFILFSNIKTGF